MKLRRKEKNSQFQIIKEKKGKKKRNNGKVNFSVSDV